MEGEGLKLLTNYEFQIVCHGGSRRWTNGNGGRNEFTTRNVLMNIRACRKIAGSRSSDNNIRRVFLTLIVQTLCTAANTSTITPCTFTRPTLPSICIYIYSYG